MWIIVVFVERANWSWYLWKTPRSILIGQPRPKLIGQDCYCEWFQAIFKTQRNWKRRQMFGVNSTLRKTITSFWITTRWLKRNQMLFVKRSRVQRLDKLLLFGDVQQTLNTLGHWSPDVEDFCNNRLRLMQRNFFDDVCITRWLPFNN